VIFMVSEPHGGELIDLNCKKCDIDFDEFGYEIKLNDREVKHVLNITNGVYSPLRGFMGMDELFNTLENMRVNIDSHIGRSVSWSIPILLTLPKDEFVDITKKLDSGDKVLFRDFNDRPFAYLIFDEGYGVEFDYVVSHLYGTTDDDHDGVELLKDVYNVDGDGFLHCLSGDVFKFEDVHRDEGLYEYYLRPKETRTLFDINNFDTIVGFQTRNVPHLGHEYLQKSALKFVDGILIHPITGQKRSGDYKDGVIIDAYRELMDNYYLSDRAVLSILESPMFYAGPREAVHHAILRKNFGCTHFIVGRDHAGVGDYYEPYEAQELLRKINGLGITIVEFKEFAYCHECGSVVDCNICPHDDGKEFISGSEIRDSYIFEGELPPDYMMRKEVAELVLSYDDPFVGDV